MQRTGVVHWNFAEPIVRETVRDLSGEHALALMILRQAATDWEQSPVWNRSELKRFFDSSWFIFLATLLEIDPDWFQSQLSRIDRERCQHSPHVDKLKALPTAQPLLFDISP